MAIRSGDWKLVKTREGPLATSIHRSCAICRKPGCTSSLKTSARPESRLRASGEGTGTQRVLAAVESSTGQAVWEPRP